MSVVKYMTVMMTAIAVLSTAATAAEFKITDRKVVFQNKNYFRYNAQQMELGSAGKKRNPVVGQKGLDELTTFRPVVKGNWKKNGPHTSTNVKKGHLSISGAFSVPTDLWKISSDDFYSLVKSGKCTFIEAHVDDLRKFAKKINERNGMINAIKNHNDARVVTSVIAVKECELTKEIEAKHKGQFNGMLKGGKLQINTDASLSVSNDFRHARRSIIGYTLHEPVWDKKKKKKRSKIVSWKPDQKGFK